MPLGMMPEMSYEEKETSLGEGDRVLFYSDGLVEAHDPKREMFGFPRLQRLVAEHAVRRIAGGLPDGGPLLLHGGGVGAGGRHDPPYPAASRIPKLNCREHPFVYEVR